MSSAQRLIPCLVAVALILAASAAPAQFDTLVSGLPEDTNLLIMANAEAILNSPLAQKKTGSKTTSTFMPTAKQAFLRTRGG